MDQTSLRVAEVIRSLGGEPSEDAELNLERLANEVIILRGKIDEAEHAEGRAERRAGNEAAAKVAAEKRARLAEDALRSIEGSINRAKREALTHGVPMRISDGGAALEIGALSP